MTRTHLFRRLLLALQRARQENLKAASKPAPVTKDPVGWTRRRFATSAGLAGTAGALSGALPLPVRAMTAKAFGRAPRVAIVGGGIAGLNAAYQLDKAGIRATVYEARQRARGRILTVTGAVGAFFVVGIALGIYMGINQDFQFTHVHAHANLLGWVALGFAGLLYAAHRQLQRGWLPHAHYGLHTIGLLLFVGGFAWGSATAVFALVPVGSSMVAVGVLLFASNVFTRLQTAPRGGAR